MEDSLEKILATVERIAFTLIALYVAIFLLNFSISLTPSGYSQSILSAFAVIFALAGIFLLFLVVVNFLSSGLPREKKKR